MEIGPALEANAQTAKLMQPRVGALDDPTCHPQATAVFDTQQDGTFSEERFTEWLQRVKQICAESGHPEVALINIGQVLIHTPPDPDGLWIRRAVATALNDREANDMRDGYRTGT